MASLAGLRGTAGSPACSSNVGGLIVDGSGVASMMIVLESVSRLPSIMMMIWSRNFSGGSRLRTSILATIFLKEPGVGASVAWHQDGTTHWESPDWHPDIHGFNFMAQLCRTTPANGLWVVPGSHKEGHIDIPKRVAANGGSTRLPDAVPMLCERGDVAVCNRQCLHASFANASPDRRATFVWGFFPRDAVLDVEVDLPTARAGDSPRRRRYSADTIRERCELVQLSIDARKARRPKEDPFRYAPCADAPDKHWTSESRQAALRRYAEGFIFV